MWFFAAALAVSGRSGPSLSGCSPNLIVAPPFSAAPCRAKARRYIMTLPPSPEMAREIQLMLRLRVK